MLMLEALGDFLERTSRGRAAGEVRKPFGTVEYLEKIFKISKTLFLKKNGDSEDFKLIKTEEIFKIICKKKQKVAQMFLVAEYVRKIIHSNYFYHKSLVELEKKQIFITCCL